MLTAADFSSKLTASISILHPWTPAFCNRRSNVRILSAEKIPEFQKLACPQSSFKIFLLSKLFLQQWRESFFQQATEDSSIAQKRRQILFQRLWINRSRLVSYSIIFLTTMSTRVSFYAAYFADFTERWFKTRDLLEIFAQGRRYILQDPVHNNEVWTAVIWKVPWKITHWSLLIL